MVHSNWAFSCLAEWSVAVERTPPLDAIQLISASNLACIQSEHADEIIPVVCGFRGECMPCSDVLVK